MQPGRLHTQEPDRHGHCHNHPGCGDDVRQTPFHQSVLSFEGLPERRFQGFCFAVIDEQANQIKKTCKPDNHSDHMQGLEPEIS